MINLLLSQLHDSSLSKVLLDHRERVLDRFLTRRR